MMPARIQRKRTKGWRLPPNTICVTRPSRWSNPYRVGACLIPDNQAAVDAFRANLPANFQCDDLRGKNLACWCRLCPEHANGKPFGISCSKCEPCHADVLGDAAIVQQIERDWPEARRARLRAERG